MGPPRLSAPAILHHKGQLSLFAPSGTDRGSGQTPKAWEHRVRDFPYQVPLTVECWGRITICGVPVCWVYGISYP